MNEQDLIAFLQWASPRLKMRWPGFRKVKRQILKRIRRRLTELGFTQIDEYRSYLEGHAHEWQVLDSFCRISISRFYRDKRVFDSITDNVLPALSERIISKGETTLRCWCAGVASGEEPYSLSIIWNYIIKQQYPKLNIEIIGTDSSQLMLDRAKQGVYTSSSVRDLPKKLLKKAFNFTNGQYLLHPYLQKNVRLLKQDIRHDRPKGPFHLVFCRNLVFTYFNEKLQKEILDPLLNNIVIGGALIIGSHEKLPLLPANLNPRPDCSCIFFRTE